VTEETERTGRESLFQLYDEFDRATARIAPVCRASGRCCDFDAYGHTLFASRLEVEHLVRTEGLARFDPATGLCPFWKERRCTPRWCSVGQPVVGKRARWRTAGGAGRRRGNQ